MRCSAHHIIASCEIGSASKRALASSSPERSEIEVTEARTLASSAVTMKLASREITGRYAAGVQLSAGKDGSGSREVLDIKYDLSILRSRMALSNLRQRYRKQARSASSIRVTPRCVTLPRYRCRTVQIAPDRARVRQGRGGGRRAR